MAMVSGGIMHAFRMLLIVALLVFGIVYFLPIWPGTMERMSVTETDAKSGNNLSAQTRRPRAEDNPERKLDKGVIF
jgi:hypothetical protein